MLQSILTKDQEISFFHQGFLILPDVVSTQLCDHAVRAINQDLGKGMSSEEAKKASSGSWCPNLVMKPVITDLYNKSKVPLIVNSLLGTVLPVPGGQIALRFPGTLCTDQTHFIPVPWWNKTWHVDGFHSPDNVIPKGEIHNFTMLVGIVLSDVLEEMSGNLVVYPGTHHVTEEIFNRTGTIDRVKQFGVEGLPEMILPKGQQVIAKKGSVVIAHYSLAHSIAPNVSPFIRYAVYFRLNSRKSQDLEPLKYIWIDYKGLKVVDNEKNRKVQIKGTLVSAKYVDAEYRDKMKEMIKRQEEIQGLVKDADDLFARHQWDLAKPLYEKIAIERNDDWMVLLKTGVCFTAGTDENDVVKGQKYIQDVIEMMPLLPNGYSLMAQNLARLKRFEEVIPMIDKMLECPTMDGQSDSVFDALKCLQNALIQLNSSHLLDSYITKALNRYPELQTRVKSLSQEKNLLVLWKKGHEFIGSIKPGVNWNDGASIFLSIIKLNPKDYWGNLLYGICLTWNGTPALGEKFIRIGFSIDPSQPHSYSTLLQNLNAQSKKNECIELLSQMKVLKFPQVETNPDHLQKIMDSIEVARQVLTKSDFQSFLIKMKSTYPTKSNLFI